MAYEITEWKKRYEVNRKGERWKPGDELRVGAFDYIRSPVHGHSEGKGWKLLRRLAKGKATEVFGYFQKFLEISGDNTSEFRGVLRKEQDGVPATAADLALTLSAPPKQVENALVILTRIGWITNNFPAVPDNSGQLPTPSRIQNNTNQNNTTQDKDIYMDFVSLKKDEYSKLLSHFGEVGTKERIAALNNYIGKIGVLAANKKYKSHYFTILSWERKNERQAAQAGGSQRQGGGQKPRKDRTFQTPADGLEI